MKHCLIAIPENAPNAREGPVSTMGSGFGVRTSSRYNAWLTGGHQARKAPMGNVGFVVGMVGVLAGFGGYAKGDSSVCRAKKAFRSRSCRWRPDGL